MTFAKSAGLVAGFVGAFGLGLAVGPQFTGDRDASSTTAHVEQAAQPAADAAPAPARPARVTKSAKAPGLAANRAVVVVPPASHPELQARLKPVLNRGADMNKAADGFRNAEEFATVAHAARETKVPFMLLKHRVLEEKMSLADAIKASQPEADAKQAVARARAAAAEDMRRL